MNWLMLKWTKLTDKTKDMEEEDHITKIIETKIQIIKVTRCIKTKVHTNRTINKCKEWIINRECNKLNNQPWFPNHQ